MHTHTQTHTENIPRGHGERCSQGQFSLDVTDLISVCLSPAFKKFPANDMGVNFLTSVSRT